MRTTAACLAVVLCLTACRSEGLDKRDVVDGLVERDFTERQAHCIADRLFDEFTGARRQRLVEDLQGDIPSEDRAVLTDIVDTCLRSAF